MNLEVSTDASSDDDSYAVRISGRRCIIWPDPERIDWHRATVAPLAVVNGLLAEAGASVRCFILYGGGNEGMMVILDPRVPELMRASGLFEDSDVPMLATH